MPPPRKHPNSEVFFGVYFPLIAGAFWGVYCGIGGFMSFFNYTESSFISITICTILLCLLFMVFVFIKMKSTLRIQAESNFKLPFLSQYWRIFWIIFTFQFLAGTLATGDVWNWVELVYLIYYIVLAILDVILLMKWKNVIEIREKNDPQPVSMQSENY